MQTNDQFAEGSPAIDLRLQNGEHLNSRDETGPVRSTDPHGISTRELLVLALIRLGFGEAGLTLDPMTGSMTCFPCLVFQWFQSRRGSRSWFSANVLLIYLQNRVIAMQSS